MGKYEKKRAAKPKQGTVIALVAVLLVLLAGFVMLRGPEHPGDAGGNAGGAQSGGKETGPPAHSSGDPAGEITEEATGEASGDAGGNTDGALPDDKETESADHSSGDPAGEITEAVTGEAPGADETEETMEFSDAIAFPLALAAGKLEIENLIQYDGLNPDCGNQEGRNIAAVTVRNRSDEYLRSAEISMRASDGSALSFVVTDLPAGGAAIVFDCGNTAVSYDTAYCDAACTAVFDAAAGMGEDLIGVSVAGTAVTLRNKTSESLSNIVVYCHATLGDRYFGGITYTYTIPSLPAGGSTVIEAADCILGLAEVVRVTINET